MDKQMVLFRFALLTLILLAASITTANAYDRYSTNQADNCATAACHGDFLADPYTSLADDTSWGANLHDVHRNTMLAGVCAVCHTSPTRSPVLLGSSDGSTGFDPISCLGCHGRTEGAGVTGAGLRQHHFVNGVISCGAVNCHPGDSDPGIFTTVGENVLPPYYTTLAMNPCNPAGEEDFAATAIGLDNDGDNLYDQNDTDCQAIVLTPDINLNPGTLDFGVVAAGNMATLDTAIQNLGTADLNVTAISRCTGTSTEFTWNPAAPFTVLPSASQTLSVTYTPVDDGIDEGCLEISSNDSDEAVKQLLLNPSGTIIQFIPAFIKPKPEEPASAQ